MQAKRKYLPILLAVLMAMATVAACSGGGGGQGQTWFNLPSLSVAFDANGNASVYGIGLGPLLTPDQLQMLQALGQKVELRIGYNGVHVYVNGEDQIYLAWDDESVANLLAIVGAIPGGDTAAEGPSRCQRPTERRWIFPAGVERQPSRQNRRRNLEIPWC
jgi:hypothetical protein